MKLVTYILVGALMAAGGGGAEGNPLATILGVVAVGFATVNVVGGYMVTDRMLGMFRRRDDRDSDSGQGS